MWKLLAMSFPVWLKLESVVKKLNLSNWFNGWFGRENKINIQKVEINNNYNYNVILSTNAGENPSKIKSSEPPIQKVKSEKQKVGSEYIELSDDQMMLIQGVNRIHTLNGNLKYNFEDDYRMALYHLGKKQKDWYIVAAAYIANAIQSGERSLGMEIFFSFFDIKNDSQDKIEFSKIKENIGYCYKRLQNIRHIDKSGELKECMISEYDRKVSGQNDLSEQDYQKIFTDFQSFLIEAL